MLKNTKGTTLIEVIVTIAVIAIAGFMLTVGMSSVIHNMGEATLITNTGNDVYSYLETDSDNAYVLSKKEMMKVTFKDGTELEEEVIVKKATKAVYNDVNDEKISMVKFEKKEIDMAKDVLEFYLRAADALTDCMDEQTWPGCKEDYNDKLEELIDGGASLDNYGGMGETTVLNQDTFAKYFHVVVQEGKPAIEIDPNVIELANKHFEQEANNGNKASQWKIGDKKLYFKVIYVRGEGADEPEVLIVAEEGSSDLLPRGNMTRLIYDQQSDSWYYKVPRKNGAQNIDDYFYNIGDITTEGLRELRQDFMLGIEWKKIEL